LSQIGSTKQETPAELLLEIIRKPSIKPTPESSSIYILEDPAPVQTPFPDSGAAVLEQEGAEGFRSIENKIFPTITNKNSQDLIYEMQNNEREILDLHTLVDRTAETFV
jgi:hypothetical protein